MSAVALPRGGGHLAHALRGKSYISMSEYANSDIFGSKKTCSWYEILLEEILPSTCIFLAQHMFIYRFLSVKWADIFGLQRS